MAMYKDSAKEYSTWRYMKQRCLNPKKDNYKYYGGRGISIDSAWLHNFHKFYADMGPCPSSKHSLDRIDSDGPYSKKNCRWATQKEQTRNKRNNLYFTLFGVKLILKDWVAIFEIPYLAAYLRIKRYGWDVYSALSTPLKRQSSR